MKPLYKYSFVFALLFMHLFLKSQTETDSIKMWTIYPGYIITMEADTVHGYIRLNNLVDNQDKALFYDNPDDKKSKVKYRAKEIKGYKVGPRTYESLDFKGQKADRKINFLLKLIEGPICYYEWYYEPEEVTKSRLIVDEEDILNSKVDLSFSEENLNNTWVAVKHGGEPVNLNTMKFIMKFKKCMAELVADYPELAEKIRNKEEGYQFGDVKKIIHEYNEWYITKEPSQDQ